MDVKSDKCGQLVPLIRGGYPLRENSTLNVAGDMGVVRERNWTHQKKNEKKNGDTRVRVGLARVRVWVSTD